MAFLSALCWTSGLSEAHLAHIFDYRRPWMPWLRFRLLNNRLSVSWLVVTWRSSQVTGSARCTISGLNSCDRTAWTRQIRKFSFSCCGKPSLFALSGRRNFHKHHENVFGCLWLFLGNKEVCQNKLFLPQTFQRHHCDALLHWCGPPEIPATSYMKARSFESASPKISHF